MRRLPPDDRLDAGDVQSQRRRAGHLRDLPQRHHRQAASRRRTCPRRRRATPATARPAGFRRRSITAASRRAPARPVTTAPPRRASRRRTCRRRRRATAATARPAWMPATFNHAGVAPGTCATCHNGTDAPRASRRRTCRRRRRATPATARPAGFRRRSTTRASHPGTCATCHNGTTAKGKPATHLPDDGVVRQLPPHDRLDAGDVQSRAACTRAPARPATTARPPRASRRRTCRRRRRATPATARPAWMPATFNHAGVAPGTCATCHNGTTAKGKPATHLPTTASCDACHRTTGGSRRRSVTPASRRAPARPVTTARRRKGKPATHLPTTASCDACHRTTGVDTGDVQPHRGDAGHLRDLPQRHDGQGQAGDARADDGVVRRLPPHDRVDPGDVQPHRSGAGHLRDLPQRHDGARASRRPTCRRRASCDACHRTTGWIPATFSHTGVRRAPARPATTGRRRRASLRPTCRRPRSCDTCHRTTALDPGDVQPHRRRAGHLRDLPQRDDGEGQAGDPRADDRVVRPVPSHDRLDTGDVHAHRRRRRAPARPATTARRPRASRRTTCPRPHRATSAIARPRGSRRRSAHTGVTPGTLRDLPQRHDGQGQAGNASAHDGVVRPVPSHDRMDPGEFYAYGCHRGDLCYVPQRNERKREACQPLRDGTLVRRVSPHHGLDADERL